MDIVPPLTSHGYDSKYTSKGNFLQAQPELEQVGDFLAIDDLLDFSNDDIGGPIEPCVSNATSSLSLSSALQIEPLGLPPFDKQLSHQNQSCGFDSDSLCVPCDDLAELEWLSNFVEESFSSGNAPACLGWGSYGGSGEDEKGIHCDKSFHTTSPVSVLESNAFAREKLCPAFSSSPDMSPVPARARSKRCRTAVCFWNTRILSPEASESLLESSSTTYTPIQATSSESNMYNTYYDYDEDDGDEDDGDYRRMHHKMKNSPLKVKNSSFKVKSSPKHFYLKPKKFKVDDATPIRKCLHCGTLKTPQWRAGPMGPKTLCNACGVRYKSGRLCDEYRPAASPTFIESVHSNSHRKVLEMRRQRGEMNGLESQKNKENSHRLRFGDGSESTHKNSDENGECDREYLVSLEEQ